MNKIFNLIASQIRSTFGNVPKLQGTQATALSGITEHFVGIGTIMSEGNVLPEHAEFATQKLYEAKLAVDAAVAYGWNGSKASNY